MNIEQFNRACAIRQRLMRIERAQERLASRDVGNDLAEYAGALNGDGSGFVLEEHLPGTVRQFIAACQDQLATEKASLEAEFAAL